VDLCFAGIFSPLRDLRASSADCREILHDDGKCVQLNNLGPKFYGALCKKISGAKNMQNFAIFWTTSNFAANIFRTDEDIQNQAST